MGGSPRGANRRFAPAWVHSFEFDYAEGIIKLFFLCCITEKYTSPPTETVHGGRLPRLKHSFLKTLSADVRRIHFSTVGGLHGERLPRPKNFFFKKRFCRRYGECLPRLKNLFFKNVFAERPARTCQVGRNSLAYRHIQYASPTFSTSTPKIHAQTPHTCIIW